MSKTLIPNVPGWMLHDTAKHFEVVEIDDPTMPSVHFLKTLTLNTQQLLSILEEYVSRK